MKSLTDEFAGPAGPIALSPYHTFRFCLHLQEGRTAGIRCSVDGSCRCRCGHKQRVKD